MFTIMDAQAQRAIDKYFRAVKAANENWAVVDALSEQGWPNNDEEAQRAFLGALSDANSLDGEAIGILNTLIEFGIVAEGESPYEAYFEGRLVGRGFFHSEGYATTYYNAQLEQVNPLWNVTEMRMLEFNPGERGEQHV